MVKQVEITFPAFRRGFYRIEHLLLENLPELPETGLLNLFIKHTSAAIMISENADPDVQTDLDTLMDKMASEDAPFYTHTIEGSDDMPAHFKSVVVGVSINIPITHYKLNLGMWQGIYLCEFRNHGGRRSLVATITA